MKTTIVVIFTLCSCLLAGALHAAENSAPQGEQQQVKAMPTVAVHQIKQSILRMGLAKGISIENAVEFMISKASELNLKMVAKQSIHEEMAARGIKTPHIQILQFCSPEEAAEMVAFNPLFSSFLPCRISIAQDANGVPWLYMMNLDMDIDERPLPPDLQAAAIRVNQKMLAVITAGATGEF